MNEIEQWLEKIKHLAYESKAFTCGLCGLLLLIGIFLAKISGLGGSGFRSHDAAFGTHISI